MMFRDGKQSKLWGWIHAGSHSDATWHKLLLLPYKGCSNVGSDGTSVVWCVNSWFWLSGKQLFFQTTMSFYAHVFPIMS